ncbi:CRP-like cAMP-binding protein [Bradyrhizobium sp. AZCC 2262]
MTPEQLSVLNGSEWFAALEPAFREAVLGSSRVKLLASGETVFHRGDPSDGIYCVLLGAVCFGSIASSGRASIAALAEAPQWFGEVALFDGGARTHDAWADVASNVLHLPSRHLTRILADDPLRWQQMGRLLVHKLRIALSLLEDMALDLRGFDWRGALSTCSKATASARPRRPATCASRKSGWGRYFRSAAKPSTSCSAIWSRRGSFNANAAECAFSIRAVSGMQRKLRRDFFVASAGKHEANALLRIGSR